VFALAALLLPGDIKAGIAVVTGPVEVELEVEEDVEDEEEEEVEAAPG
jgi:hypothetical protein